MNRLTTFIRTMFLSKRSIEFRLGPVLLASALVMTLVSGATLLTSQTAIQRGAAENASADTTYRDIERTLGKVPTFIRQFPKAALPGAWREIKALQFSEATALSAKEKSLISLAVSAQIPCNYCIWEDTQSAKHAGASDQEIQEAVAIAALTRHWSTVFNGMQVDFDRFKADLGGDADKTASSK